MRHILKIILALFIAAAICIGYVWSLIPSGDIVALRRENLTYDFLPENYQDLAVALVLAEDYRFSTHHGIDVIEIFTALKNWIIKGRDLRGASTITQQLARTLFLSQDRTFLRKIAETILALKLEYYLSKDEILVLYLKNVMFGKDLFGFQNAAMNYWEKNSADLTYEESLILFTLLPAPETYQEYVDCGHLSKKARAKIHKMALNIELLKKIDSYKKVSESFSRVKIFEAMKEKNIGDILDEFPSFSNVAIRWAYQRARSSAWKTVVMSIRLVRKNTCDNPHFATNAPRL